MNGTVRAALTITLPLLAAMTVPSEGRADSRRHYMNRYVLMVDWLTRTESWITTHLDDQELCRAAHVIAERQVELARRMTPPAELTSVHPHFLIAMENTERMFYKAAEGDRKAFRKHRRIVREEFRFIADILQANSIFVPSLAP